MKSIEEGDDVLRMKGGEKDIKIAHGGAMAAKGIISCAAGGSSGCSTMVKDGLDLTQEDQENKTSKEGAKGTALAEAFLLEEVAEGGGVIEVVAVGWLGVEQVKEGEKGSEFVM